MKLSCTIAALGILIAGCRQPARPSFSGGADETGRMIQEVRRVVPSVSEPESESETLALLPAHFSDRNPEMVRRVGNGTSGEDLYLFPDHSYLYLQWADILPPTIYDRGTWLFQGGVVSLESDHSVRQRKFPNDRRFVPLFYKISGKRTLLLMGTNWSLSYFKENAKPGDDFMLFLCTLTHIEAIEPARAEALKQKMYAESWKPEFFTK